MPLRGCGKGTASRLYIFLGKGGGDLQRWGLEQRKAYGKKRKCMGSPSLTFHGDLGVWNTLWFDLPRSLHWFCVGVPEDRKLRLCYRLNCPLETDFSPFVNFTAAVQPQPQLKETPLLSCWLTSTDLASGPHKSRHVSVHLQTPSKSAPSIRKHQANEPLESLAWLVATMNFHIHF